MTSTVSDIAKQPVTGFSRRRTYTGAWMARMEQILGDAHFQGLITEVFCSKTSGIKTF